MNPQTLAPGARTQLERSWSTELALAKQARIGGNSSGEWSHLERAHILSQPMAGPHVRTHLAMLGAATRRRDVHEVVGQLFRIAVAAPGTLTGKYPVGNTGGADVSAFAPMAVPEDLRELVTGVAGGSSNDEPGDASDLTFPTDPTGLDEATPVELVELDDGDRCAMRITPVVKTLDGNRLRMLSYNGSIPGPVLHVQQGAEVTFDVRNDGDLEATVHWHGLRLQNEYDGVPFETQAPIPIGGTYTQKVTFPDAGFYWYHPHIREDYGLELGLYGTVVVEPTDPSYWPPADRFLSVTVDDILIEDGKVAPFLRSGPTYTAMGRFGNVMLTNGETAFTETAAVGEVVRFYVVNTANTRIFKFAINGARMKLVGGDSGRCEAESFVDSVLLAPSERAVLDVLFDSEGDVSLEHQTPEHVYHLGTISVTGSAHGDAARAFDQLRTDPALSAVREQLADHLERPPDKTLAFWSEMPLLYGDDGTKTVSDTTYHECPMHTDIAASFAATCPKCGMKLVPTESASPTSTPYVCPMHEEIVASWAATCPLCGMTLLFSEGASATVADESQPHTHDRADSIEWEDDMVAINRDTDATNMIWQLIDRDTGAKNGDIAWKFTVGDQVKIRLVNEMGSDHPMPHPFHVHGAGRFIVLSKDGVVEQNLVWKDTVLLLAGQTVDILLDVTNPGLWMAHCHIAEHNQSGMMFSFEVAPNTAVAGAS